MSPSFCQPQPGHGLLGCPPTCTKACCALSSHPYCSAGWWECVMGLPLPPSPPAVLDPLVNFLVQLSPLFFPPCWSTTPFPVLWLFYWKNRKLNHSIMFLWLNRRPKCLSLSIQDLTPVLTFRETEKGDLFSACKCGCPPFHSIFLLKSIWNICQYLLFLLVSSITTGRQLRNICLTKNYTSIFSIRRRKGLKAAIYFSILFLLYSYIIDDSLVQ